MPPLIHIIAQLKALLGMMSGAPDATKKLDTSEAAFWSSFYAIMLAAPFLFLGWINAIQGSEGALTLGQLPRFAFVDLVGWLLPLGLITLLASKLDIKDRLIAYIIAANWSGLIFSFFYLPLSLATGGVIGEGSAGIFIGVFIFTLWLSWRVQDAVLQKGRHRTFIVFMITLLTGLMSVIMLQDMLGLTLPMDIAVPQG